MSASVWINGEPQGTIDPADRGLAYGDGLFETLRVIRGAAVLEARHWQRLSQGCERLGIPFDLPAEQASFTRFLAGRTDGIAKVIVTRGIGGRGYLPPAEARPTVVFAWHEAPVYPPEHVSNGVTAGFCNQPLGISPLLAGLKHLNRLEQVLLRQELERLGHPEALVCDVSGAVIEGVISNVFLVRSGALCTPVLERAGVAGVMRAEIIAQAPRLGLAVTETTLSQDDFLGADEVFFCNSVYGIWPVCQLGGRQFASPGAVTQRLQQALMPLFA